MEEHIKQFSIESLINFEFTPELLKVKKYGWKFRLQELFNALKNYKYTFRQILNT